MRVTVVYRNREVVIAGAQIASPQWYIQIENRNELDLLLPDEQRRRFVSLRGMESLTFEYEAGDSELEARLCGVTLSPAQAKTARESLIGRPTGTAPVRLYSDWHP